MKPRGYWHTFLLLALVNSISFALLWTLLFSAVTDLKFGQVLPIALCGSIGFGLLTGAIMAFSLKASTITIPIQDGRAFTERLTARLARLGYHLESQTTDILTFKPSLKAGLFAPRITVRIQETSATIVGSSSYIQKLLRQFRSSE